ncbi:response regulator [Polyangium jinanense]|uniref:Response regulator n=1 Tax=Polyangium jinanense TaxID=2829994 RepID=A0A9X3X130_9BACT|nr:response regulator [Polyangium jinanense]MDC3955421.1 response regulator [Polyangium jinanense]MDC3981722.1 response regulator [Polyangium jinanense]
MVGPPLPDYNPVRSMSAPDPMNDTKRQSRSLTPNGFPGVRARRTRILVIDDDPRFGESAVQRLADMGFEARFHHGPLGVLQAIRDMRCDLVLLDVNMPKLDGSIVIRMIRDSNGLGEVRVLLCSNMEANVLVRMAQFLGAYGAVPKDVGDAAFVAELRAALQKRPAIQVG